MRSTAAVKRCLGAATFLLCLLVSGAPAGAHDGFHGRLDIRHTDDFTHSASSTRYALEQAHGKRFRVRPTRTPNVPSGSRVTIDGRKRGRVISGRVKPRPGVRAAAATLGTYKVAVLLVNFTDRRSEPWSTDEVGARFFTDPDSLDVFFKEQSWDQVDLDGQVYDWIELTRSSVGCDDRAWATEAKQQALAAGVPLASFNSIAYVFPDVPECGYAGLAELPGNELWLNGDISVRVASHELGHNMGVHHASALACSSGGVGVAIGGSCAHSEYGDPFSTMGSATKRMAGWHLQQLGYMQPSNVQSVTADGIYTLRPTLGYSTQPQLLKIPRGPGEWYYVDLRAAGGVFDNFLLTDPAVTGVTIRIGGDVTDREQSRLIDTTPDSNANSTLDFKDAPLSVGRTFSDGNVAITTTALGGGVASVQVAWDGTPPDTQAPTAPVFTDATHHGSYVDLSWAPSSDDVGVAGYRVKRNGVTLATVTGTAYRDYSVSAGSSYSYCLEAFDAAGNKRAGSACSIATYYVPPTSPPPPAGDDSSGDGADPPGGGTTPPPPPADVTAPVVRIRAPGSRAKLRRRAIVRANATDAVGVNVVEFWVDNIRLAAKRGGTLNLVWQLKRVKPGRHRVTVIARDAAGNAGKRTITVTVRR